ncbi:hypothetical protein [Colwellia sp. UCD-KL20]|uniref:hypothetical protein n=1 Tax=Colwellia sp. UCD-KL20 TaxID=1917165 RepID=UPI00097037E4|nr:hypothetical protein [Colwellia sp. UCD-KL20]
MKLSIFYTLLAILFSALSMRKGSFCLFDLCSKYQYNMSNSALIYGAFALFFLIISIKRLLLSVNLRNESKLTVKNNFSNDHTDG